MDTIDYLRKNTDLPIPEVFLYDSRIDNDVGAPYVIEELVSHTPRSLPLRVH